MLKLFLSDFNYSITSGVCMGHRKRGSERRECSHQKRRNFWRGASKIVPFERDKGRAAAAAASARTSASTLALSLTLAAKTHRRDMN